MAGVLITSVSQKVPLVEAFRGALAELEPEGRVWGADVDPDCVGREFVDRFWHAPPSSEFDAELLADLCIREGIDLVLPTRDGELAHLAALREPLAERGVLVLVSSVDAVEACTDKLEFFRRGRAAGLPVIASATEPAADLGERLVVKERSGRGSRAIGLDLDRPAAAALGRSLSEPLYQPFIEGDEHSIDLYTNRAREIIEVVPRRRVRVQRGESVISETVEAPELVELGVETARAFELTGHSVLQAFVLADGGGARLIECNPRVGGASTLAFAAGVRTPEWSLREARGERIKPRLSSYRRGLRLIRYASDRIIEPQ